MFKMKKSLAPILFIMFCACTPIAQSTTGNNGTASKRLRLDDAVYEEKIQTVRLFPQGSPLAPPVTRLGQWNLILDFDELTTDRDTYFARILHCNYNWTQSSLQELDYISDYNEFPINNSDFSVDTHLPYVHYWFNIPAVKLPGNYVVVVYRGSDKDDILLSRRFMVFDPRVSFLKDPNSVGAGSVAREHQQINFTVNHSNVEILNPMQDVKVNIRQNQRWDNMATDLKPTFIRDIQKELEYRFFEESKMFRGGNEFRFFDLRSLNNPGRNVGYVNRNAKPPEVYIARDKPRADEAYAQYEDLNGNFIIGNLDFQDPATTNYAYVTFSLTSPPLNADVYVAGALNYWNLNARNKMSYDSTAGLYTSRMLLKQGWYDYQYVVRGKGLPSDYYEGTYFQTENRYEVFVYYRPFQPQADLLIGYLSFEENRRR